MTFAHDQVVTPARPVGRLRRRMSWLASMVAAAAVLAGSPRAEAVYIRADKSVTDYDNLAAKSSFSPAGYLADPSWGIAFSSGTLVSPTKVLTAAHVVDENGDLKIDDPAQFKRISFGLGKNLPSSFTSNIASVAINPAYKGGLAGFDLAVLTLKKPITSVVPAKLSSAPAVGLRGAMIGYGYQGTGSGRSLKGATDKLAAYNMISAYENNTYLTDFDSPRGNTNTYGSTSPLTYEGTTAPGDSGGPLYADFGSEAWRIVGVLNGGFNDFGGDSLYGDVSIYASLSNAKNVSFLQSQGLSLSPVRATSSATASLGSQRSIDVPEPASISLLSAAGLLALARRRKTASHPV